MKNNISLTPIIDAYHETGKILTYDYYIFELKYIQDSLIFIDKNIKVNLEDMEIRFSKEIPNKDFKKKILKQHKSMRQSIIEGLFIRQIALIEKFFVKLSLAIYNEESNKRYKYRPVIYPPWYDKEKNKKYFTDSLKAVKYLKETFNISINNKKEWEIYKNMTEIRHQLAHGRTILKFESVNIYNRHNNIGKILIPLADNSQYAHLNIDVIPHVNLAESFIKLIKDTEECTYEKHLSRYFPKPE